MYLWSKYTKTSLYRESKNGNSASVRALLKLGIDVNQRNYNDRTPLHEAAKYGYDEIVTLLIKVGVNVNLRDKYNQTALDNAASSGAVEIMTLLIEAGARVVPVITTDRLYNPRSFYYAGFNRNIKVAERLFSAGAKVEEAGKYSQVLFYGAIREGYFELVEAFIMAGQDVNQIGMFEKTPLHQAAKYGQEKVVTLLIKKGASITQVNQYSGKTALHEAAMHGHDKVMTLLLKAGASLDQENQHNGRTLLHEAATYGRDKIVTLLLKAGVSVNPLDDDKQTPLHIAIKSKQMNIVKILIFSGASVRNEDIEAIPKEPKGRALAFLKKMTMKMWVKEYFSDLILKEMLFSQGRYAPVSQMTILRNEWRERPFWCIAQERYPWLYEESFEKLIRKVQEKKSQVQSVENSVLYPERNKTLTLLFNLGQEQVRQESFQDKADSGEYQMLPYKKTR